MRSLAGKGGHGGGGAPEAQSCILQERGFDWGISRTQSIQLPAPPAPWESWGLPPAPTEAAKPSPTGVAGSSIGAKIPH